MLSSAGFALASSRKAPNMGVPEVRTGNLPRLHKGLHIYCSITMKAMSEDGFPLIAHIQRAQDLLASFWTDHFDEFGPMRENGFADVLDFHSDFVVDTDESRRPWPRVGQSR